MTLRERNFLDRQYMYTYMYMLEISYYNLVTYLIGTAKRSLLSIGMIYCYSALGYRFKESGKLP